MRTTSRSGSENNFFTSNTNAHLTLVEFYMRFESAIDSRRHNQGQLDNDSKHKQPELKTQMGIEIHGSKVYTTNVFYEFQAEVEIGFFKCGLDELIKRHELEIFKLNEEGRKRSFQVIYNSMNQHTTCSCKKFIKQGIPCRQMIWVWKAKMLQKIPEEYVLNRWATLAARKPILDLDGNVLEQCVASLDHRRILNDLWSEIYTCVGLVHNDPHNLEDLVQNIKGFRLGLEGKNSETNTVSTTSKNNDIEMLVGSTAPYEILIKPPKISKNKGIGVHVSNSDKRFRGEKEKAVEESQKRKRKCNGCHTLANHDIRNCPLKVKR